MQHRLWSSRWLSVNLLERVRNQSKRPEENEQPASLVGRFFFRNFFKVDYEIFMYKIVFQ